MKFSFLVCFFPAYILLSPTASAQKNFEPGYIVNAANDTVRGSIEYLNWSKNPEKINFKTNGAEAEKQLGLEDVSSFSVHDEQYVRAYVNVDESPYKTGELSTSPIPQSRPDTVFLRVIAEGPKSLYFLKDGEGREHFFIKKNDKYDWLTTFRYQYYQNGQTGIVVVDSYKQQLAEYFEDCKALDGKTSGLNYSQKSINRLFEIYYEQCAPNKAVKVAKAESLGLEFGVVAGVSSTKIKLSGASAPLLFKGNLPASTQAAGGLFLNLILPRTQKRISVYNELFLSSYKTVSRSETYVSEQDHSYTDFGLGYTYLKLNNMARYTVPVGTGFLFINGGISNGFVLSEKNYKKTETYFYSVQGAVSQTKAINETRKYEQGFLLGIGGTVKNLSLEIRMEKSNGVSPYNHLKTGVTRYFALLSYRIK